MGFLSANHGNLARHGTTAPALDWQGPSRGDYQGTRQGAQRPPPPKDCILHTEGQSPNCIPRATRLSSYPLRTLSRYLSSPSHSLHLTLNPARHENTDPTLSTSTTLQRPPHLRDLKPQKQCSQEGLNAAYQRVVIQG